MAQLSQCVAAELTDCSSAAMLRKYEKPTMPLPLLLLCNGPSAEQHYGVNSNFLMAVSCDLLLRPKPMAAAATWHSSLTTACIMSVQQQSVSSAVLSQLSLNLVFSQLSLNLSALTFFVMHFMCCTARDWGSGLAGMIIKS